MQNRGDILHEYRRDIHEYRRDNQEYRPISHEYRIDTFSIFMVRSRGGTIHHISYDTI